MPAKKEAVTAAGSHVASARGYAKGSIVEMGEPVPAGIPVSDRWMVEASEVQDEAE